MSSETPYTRSLFLFHRDLRLEDNTGLIESLRQSQEVIPAFIFSPQQVDDNSYKGSHSIQFMIESLEDLDQQLQERGSQLYVFYGETPDVVKNLINEHDIEAVFFNRDYTPFARQRDQSLKALCDESNVVCKQYADSLLQEPETVHKDDGDPYVVYTPFARKSREFAIRSVQENSHDNYFNEKLENTVSLQEMQNRFVPHSNDKLFTRGGRKQALQLLTSVNDLADYKERRDFPAEPGTSGLSAHNKFGTLSVREFYWQIVEHFGEDHTLINELYWRDFYTHIAYHFPHVFGKSFQKKYDSITWNTDESMFQAWCEGKTGFPIVDAGMRQLNATGWMHNRVRMIVASFLVKDLHIDWRWGEKYFAQKLIDYDPAVNNGSWQWAASTGCDAQPYFRIFNPWLQQKRYDKDAVYIKRWVPELANIEAKLLHKIFDKPLEGVDYPAPIVEHKAASTQAKEMFKAIV